MSSFSEKTRQTWPDTSNVGQSLSSCHHTKHNLINSLEVEVNESADGMETPHVALPYKISRFHRASLYLMTHRLMVE